MNLSKAVLKTQSREWFLLGGTVIDPSQNLDAPMDVWIRDGKIAAISKPGSFKPHPSAGVIQLTPSQWVVPGLIDIHVHLREPGLEYKETIETGTQSAAAGGFSSVACMANTSPVNDTPYTTAFIRERAKETAFCRVFVVGAVTKGLKGEELAEIGGMVKEGAVAISDDGLPVMNSYVMRKAMDYARAFGIPVISHAEDLNLVGQGVMNESALSSELGLRGIPAAAEEILVAREIALCRLTKTPTHIQHISTAVGLEHVRRAKDAGLPVTAEASPHHLTLTEDAVRTYDTRFKMSPPLRSHEDVEALIQGIKDGVIDIIATDHAPHGEVDKQVEFSEASNGVVGLQTAVPVTLDLVTRQLISKKQWVSAYTLGPSRLLNLGLGTLKNNATADLTIIDPEVRYELHAHDLHSKSANCPFLDKPLQGKAVATLVAGELMYLDSRLKGHVRAETF